MLPPKNLVEMVEIFKIRTDLENESVDKKDNISLIANNIIVLGELCIIYSAALPLFLPDHIRNNLEKHKIKMSDEMYDLYNKLWDSWKTYKTLLMKAEEILQIKQREFQEIALRDQENLKHEFTEFEELWNTFKKNAASNSEINASGSYNGLRSNYFSSLGTHYVRELFVIISKLV